MGADEIIQEQGPVTYLDSGLVLGDGTHVRFPLDVSPVSWNAIFFSTLLLVTPLRVIRARWAYIAVALVLLAASHVAFFTFSTFTMIATAYDKNGLGFVEPRLLRALGVATQVYANMLCIALPFLLYAPVVLWRRRPALRAPPGLAPSRNAPCPCGSGLKFKRCCGR